MVNIKKEFIDGLGFKYIGEIKPSSKYKIRDDKVFEEGFENVERDLIIVDGFLPNKKSYGFYHVSYEAELIMSIEAPQDLKIQQALLYSDRAGPISQEQITEWKEAYQQIQSMNLSEIREKVVFDCDLLCELKEYNDCFDEEVEKPWRV